MVDEGSKGDGGQGWVPGGEGGDGVDCEALPKGTGEAPESASREGYRIGGPLRDLVPPAKVKGDALPPESMALRERIIEEEARRIEAKRKAERALCHRLFAVADSMNEISDLRMSSEDFEKLLEVERALVRIYKKLGL